MSKPRLEGVLLGWFSGPFRRCFQLVLSSATWGARLRRRSWSLGVYEPWSLLVNRSIDIEED